MMKPNYRLLYTRIVVLLCLFAGACSSQKSLPGNGLPAWADHPGKAYDENEYLLAVGSGNTLKEAHDDALGNLARIFRADINASQELIDEFIETSRNDEFSSEQTTQLLNVTRIGSSQNLMNTRILESEVAGNGTYYALAGMNRSKTASMYNQEISHNELKINEYETNAEQEADPLQSLILLKKALVFAEVNENLSRQRSILLGRAAGSELNTMALTRIQEKLRIIKQQVPVSIQSTSATETILSAIALAFQQEGFTIDVHSREPILEVTVDYHSQKAELNRDGHEFVKWELIVNIVNNQSGQSLTSFLTEGRDGAYSYSDALKRADFSARKEIGSSFKKFLKQELLTLK